MQRKQFIVKLENEKAGNKFIKFLEAHGFCNIHNINFDSLRIKILVIDDTVFFSTNTTCLAALSSLKIKPMSIKDFLDAYRLHTDNTNEL